MIYTICMRFRAFGAGVYLLVQLGPHPNGAQVRSRRLHETSDIIGLVECAYFSTTMPPVASSIFPCLLCQPDGNLCSQLAFTLVRYALCLPASNQECNKKTCFRKTIATVSVICHLHNVL